MELTTTIKIGQVWRSKIKEHIGDKIVIIAISDNNVFVSGYVDEVDPEITIDYLLKRYELDNKYRI